MARTEAILRKARYRLNDIAAKRWGDPQLIDLLNDGQDDIAKQAKYYKGEAYLQLAANQARYALPENTIQLNSAVHKGKELPIISTDRAEKLYGKLWRTHTSENISCLVCGQLDTTLIQVYPKPVESHITIFDTELFGVVDTISIPSTGLENSVYVSTDDVGILSDIIASNLLILQYIRTPIHVVELEDAPEVSPVFDTALSNFIAGMALQDDTVTQNRERGAQLLQLYSRDLQELIVLSTKHLTTARYLETNYNGIG